MSQNYSISPALVYLPVSSKAEGGGTGEGENMLQLLARLSKAFNSLCVIEGFRALAGNLEVQLPPPSPPPAPFRRNTVDRIASHWMTRMRMVMRGSGVGIY